jgi:hypothetical protein
MKAILIFLTLGSVTALGEVVGKLGASADLPTSDGWVLAGRTEIPEEKTDVWTTRNTGRRESIQFSVMPLDARDLAAQKQAVSSWERGLLADGRKEKIAARDIELSGRKARYIVARWVGRDAPFFHFVMVVDEGRAVFFSIISPTDSDLGGESAAAFVRSVHFNSH